MIYSIVWFHLLGILALNTTSLYSVITSGRQQSFICGKKKILFLSIENYHGSPFIQWQMVPKHSWKSYIKPEHRISLWGISLFLREVHKPRTQINQKCRALNLGCFTGLYPSLLYLEGKGRKNRAFNWLKKKKSLKVKLLHSNHGLIFIFSIKKWT